MISTRQEGRAGVPGRCDPSAARGGREDYAAMVLGLRDYVLASRASPCRNSQASGGSTARWSRRSPPTRSGRGAVRCVMLPSEYTSGASLEDAAAVAAALRPAPIGCRSGGPRGGDRDAGAALARPRDLRRTCSRYGCAGCC